MGGRRASSLSEIVGAGSRLAPLSRSLGRALTAEDPGRVAAATAHLLADGAKSTDILYYASQLTDFIRRVVESGKDLSYEKRESLARQEWSRIKARDGLTDDAIVTQALVSAAARSLARQKK
jgi:hypothetical protein